MRLCLVLGGAASGKSLFAENLALRRKRGGKPVYIATADKAAAEAAGDSEMQAKIAAHRARRAGWENCEAPLMLASAIARAAAANPAAILVDCLSLWLTNLLLGGYEIRAETENLLSALRRAQAMKSETPLILVSNEVGQGIVPDNALARRFRAQAGALNQAIAAAADDVYWLAAGLAQQLKG